MCGRLRLLPSCQEILDVEIHGLGLRHERIAGAFCINMVSRSCRLSFSKRRTDPNDPWVLARRVG
jgi:hypothetical protein